MKQLFVSELVNVVSALPAVQCRRSKLAYAHSVDHNEQGSKSSAVCVMVQ